MGFVFESEHGLKFTLNKNSCEFEMDAIDRKQGHSTGYTKCDALFINGVAEKHGLTFNGEKLKKRLTGATACFSSSFADEEHNIFLSAKKEIADGLARQVFAVRIPMHLKKMLNENVAEDLNNFLCAENYELIKRHPPGIQRLD